MREKLWKIIQQRDGNGEAPDRPSGEIPRRTFIEMIGYSAAALAFSSCRPPDQKIVPYVKQPVELTPGVANWYASTCGGCSAGCGVLVKVRDGRPIKLEGNPDHPLSRGGLCTMAHGLVFSLYDADRLRQPLIRFEKASWEQVDQQIIEQLREVRETRGKVRVCTPPIISPTSREVIARFLSQFADGKHVIYDPISYSGIREAHRRSHGVAAIPLYRFEHAKVVVSFGADFLGTWLSPAQFTRGYSQARNLRDGRNEMLRHIQFESRMSLTGTNADSRIPVSPAEETNALVYLTKLMASRSSGAEAFGGFDSNRLSEPIQREVETVAREIEALDGQSLIISGSNDPDVQYLVNVLNHLAGAYGSTVDLAGASRLDQGWDSDMREFVREMNADEVAVAVICGANPAYDYYDSEEFTLGLTKVPLKISLNSWMDETSAYADYVCPQHHFLESWDDSECADGVFSLTQPAIAPLFKTRAYQESLMRWSGDDRAYHDVLRSNWKDRLFPSQTRYANFDEFWDNSLHDGVFASEKREPAPADINLLINLSAAVNRIAQVAAPPAGSVGLVLYEPVALRNGAHANNPWLQELPDPVSKITWDNYVNVSPKVAREMEIEEGSVIRFKRGYVTIELPAHIQPGQHDSCFSIALGYGRTRGGRVAEGIGANAYPFASFVNGSFDYHLAAVAYEKTGEKVKPATTQPHHSLDGRPIVHDLGLADYLAGAGVEGNGHGDKATSIWKEYEYPEHKWGLAIDLNACVGCSACLLSCQAENNVPVVGKAEVQRQREMHWIRVDRYFEGSEDNPATYYQPVMCMQCDNASCESVCPVLATVHSSEGLNMQVYNRCVGTRYCSNNCPYKVRRFNWFEHDHSDPIANLALNPDVTVRTRGVMEKCTFCVQRIQEVKIRARNENRPIRDGEIQPACQQSCPADAIVFGDLVDPESRVSRLKRDRRDYVLLEELNLKPATSYLAKVRNDAGAGEGDIG